MPSTLEDLKTLHKIIGDALAEFDSAFGARGLDYPSLRDGSDETEAEAEAERLAATPPLLAASNRIVAASEQLIATVRSPYGSVCDAAMSFLIPACFRLTESAHVVEILREAGGDGVRVEDIASKTNMDPSKLAHAMRLLATHHIFREVTPGVFKNNRITSYIDTGKSVADILTNPEKKYEGTGGMAAFVACAGDEFLKSAAFLTEAATDPAWGHSRLPTETPFNIAWKTNHSFFAFMEQPENKRRAERFGTAIKATDRFSSPDAILQSFPWGALLDSSVVVDVGGGVGASMMVINSQFPQLKCVIQDLGGVCTLGERLWRTQNPQALTTGCVQFQEHDFFTPQPVTDASIFFLRTILHDWSDSYAIQILLRLRHAATPATKLIIAEHLMAYACADDSETVNIAGAPKALAPAPLLANLGRANSIMYAVDMNMHVMFNAQERTISELRKLTVQAGWDVVEVRRLEESLFGYLIAVPGDIPPT